MTRVLPEKYEVEFEHRRLSPDDVASGRREYKRGVYDYQTWLSRITRRTEPAHVMKKKGQQISANGGITYCFVRLKEEHVPEDETDNLRLVTFAVCSVHDNFSKKKGRDISLGRALKQLEKDGELS